MKKITILLLALVLLVGFFGYQRLSVEKVYIIMREDSFQPKNITIKKRTEVVFRNEGKKAHWPASDFHPTHGIYPEFDPTRGIEPGGEWSFRFEKVGKWKFHDHLYPSVKGEIKVVSN